MKFFKTPLVFLAALGVSMIFASTTLADLTASQFVADFNAMNTGRGLQFTYSNSGYPGGSQPLQEFWITNAGASTTFADTGAYSSASGRKTTGTSGGLEYFTAFCVAPERTTVSGTVTGQLSYESGTGYTKTSDGTYLTVGAAFLYMSYASGQLTNHIGQYFEAASQPFYYQNDYERSYGIIDLQNAVRQLMSGNAFTGDWVGNSFLLGLSWYFNDLGIMGSSEETKAFLLSRYDANADYSFMDGYTVFVMNATQSGTISQDVLYMTNSVSGGGGGNGGGDAVPEPAMLLFWAIGSLGLGCSYLKRKRQLKS